MFLRLLSCNQCLSLNGRKSISQLRNLRSLIPATCESRRCMRRRRDGGGGAAAAGRYRAVAVPPPPPPPPPLPGVSSWPAADASGGAGGGAGRPRGASENSGVRGADGELTAGGWRELLGPTREWSGADGDGECSPSTRDAPAPCSVFVGRQHRLCLGRRAV